MNHDDRLSPSASRGSRIDPLSDDAGDGFSEISGVMALKGCRMPPMAWLPLPCGHTSTGMLSICGSVPGLLEAGGPVIHGGRPHRVAWESLGSWVDAFTGCSHGGPIRMGSHDAAVGC